MGATHILYPPPGEYGGRHANLALLSLVGSMAYGFAINQSSMQSIEDQP